MDQTLSDREQRRLQREARVRPSPMTAMIRKPLSKWGVKGLNLADTGFSKLHANESKYEESRKKYDLSSEHFKNFVDNLLEKVDRNHAVNDFKVQVSQNPDVYKYVLKEYTSITVTKMKENRDAIWPAVATTHADQEACDEETDSQIK